MNTRANSNAVFLITWIALLLLLAVTWFASRFNLGIGNLVVAMVIAGIQLMLVVLIFMHVRHSSHLIWIFAAAGVVWLSILVTLSMTDYLTRRAVDPYRGPTALGAPH